MKKWVTTAMAAMLMFACVGCGQKEQVDERDMSRWIVEFSSKYPNDMGKTELTIKELLKMDIRGNYFTVKFQFYTEYVEISKRDLSFDLLPDMALYYVNDAGERIENGELNDDKYSLVCRGRDKYDPIDKIYEGTGRAILPGKYRIKYSLSRNADSYALAMQNEIETFYIDIVVGDISI